ncbi:M23 family metallopeptidase [Burkholderia sp. Ac-20344]|uniref:M23 family metallopeptidase n=1 Tax=Burkholderia sp. Ac-20344 TaxID=2703890 RepID=UPI00197B573A|nr:M23 family metallopeptidase [Burkholderia sp. Ac-20344]MBN3833853.1 M23 family metallopeptidase [Burkholderia sp. Ac-20344]
MIISPPFLPKAGFAAPTGTNPDPMMDAVDQFEGDHGIYPIAHDRRWHCGMHLQSDTKGEVYAIADGEVVAYRVCQHAVDSGKSHTGFVLLKHTTETGEGRTLTFYSLYMHLLPLAEYQEHGANAEAMPEFLRMPTGPVSKGQVTQAVSGEGKKVRRKDVLGWCGQYEGMPHLHLEIFMLPADFDTYFGSTQLGRSVPTPPNGTDWWGHAYFIIPAGSDFRRLPEKADARNKLHGIEFRPGQEGSNTLPLLVETYFTLGSKYTKVWSVAQDGTRTLLTPQPVEEKDYEYDLYKRATALYSSCPSDGYELLRFGCILSPSQTLAADARATWMQVNWAADKVGYIDINDSSIQKFSDADFLSLMGWQKITEGNTPFDSDGMCDVDALREILDDATPHEVAAVTGETPEIHKARVLWAYVKSNTQVRQQLRGFVCNAPSEWDSTNNEERYARLLDEGGFYHGNDKGYNDFMKYLKDVQFWDKTGLPAGQALWFFHPLEFIRHFRKSAWFSKDEFALIYSNSHMSGNASAIREKYRKPLNFSLRKYGLTSNLKQSHFLGQGAVESKFLCGMQETSMVGKVTEVAVYGERINQISEKSEKDLGHWYGEISSEDDPYFRLTKYSSKGGFIASSYSWRFGNCDSEDAQKFRGRGFKQLTFRSNYSDYWLYRGWIAQTNFSASWWNDPQYRLKNRALMKKIPAHIENPQIVATEPENCLDSGAWYITCLRSKVLRAIDRDDFCLAKTAAELAREKKVIVDITMGINGGDGGIGDRVKYTRMIKKVLL